MPDSLLKQYCYDQALVCLSSSRKIEFEQLKTWAKCKRLKYPLICCNILLIDEELRLRLHEVQTPLETTQYQQQI